MNYNPGGLKMAEIGYALSSEEHTPNDLVRHAKMAEDAGFTFALISDHYHPWVDAQGHSPFVWAVIGGIANATERLRLGTGVTCPHPPGDHRPGRRDVRRDDARPLLPRRRLG